MTTAEQPAPEGDKQPPQAASVDSPEDGSDDNDADSEDKSS
ncbi:hypothetical protein [Mycobacterium sp. IS-836]|nr:hypothetical protein [Mycobacterium sp. IS-836]